MGEHLVDEGTDPRELGSFMRRILDDLQALEEMLESDMIETGIRRVGAEQEMFLVDATGGPAPMAVEVLETLGDSVPATTELGRFNLEVNLEPQVFETDCLSRLETELNSTLATVRQAAAQHGARVLLTGILPTMSLDDLTLANMTPNPRYFTLNKTMKDLRGGKFQTLIKGLDELQVTHDNILLEACNTSFQIHFQVSPGEFARLYNVAQAVTAPVMAAGVNSPLLLRHRLWRETRVALFQQSIDERASAMAARGVRTRVRFGDRWVKQSILDIFREDITRSRVMLKTEVQGDPIAMVRSGKAPPLTALRLHNGTIYRWNRPCYGVDGAGVPHLRIENRVLPSGPTVIDEVANAAFFYGLMSAVLEEYGDIAKEMDFDDAAGNFLSAARHGLMAQFRWVGGHLHKASDLILDTLLPLAREGLAAKDIESSDIDRYLGVIQERVRSQQTGSQWMLGSLAKMGDAGQADLRFRSIVQTALDRQWSGQPVHEWPLADAIRPDGLRASYRQVGQFMTRDLFTVRPSDIVDLAAALMQWEHIRHVPVEDDEGRVVGLVSHRDLLTLVGQRRDEPVPIEDIMKRDVITVSPRTPTLDAMTLMRKHKVGCLPVVDAEDKLCGILTESDLLEVAALLLEEHLGD